MLSPCRVSPRPGRSCRGGPPSHAPPPVRRRCNFCRASQGGPGRAASSATGASACAGSLPVCVPLRTRVRVGSSIRPGPGRRGAVCSACPPWSEGQGSGAWAGGKGAGERGGSGLGACCTARGRWRIRAAAGAPPSRRYGPLRWTVACSRRPRAGPSPSRCGRACPRCRLRRRAQLRQTGEGAVSPQVYTGYGYGRLTS